MSDATQQLLINGGYAVLLALISAWAGWKSQQAKDASKAAESASKANGTAIVDVQQSADKAAVKAEQAVVKAQEAVKVTVAGNQQVAEVHALVNGQRDAMLTRIAELEAELKAIKSKA